MKNIILIIVSVFSVLYGLNHLTQLQHEAENSVAYREELNRVYPYLKKISLNKDFEDPDALRTNSILSNEKDLSRPALQAILVILFCSFFPMIAVWIARK